MVGLALQNYHSAFNHYPSPDFNAHSWRIRCLPFVLASPMYGEYNFDGPWDSDSNISVDTKPLPTKTLPQGGSDGLPLEEPHGMPYAYQCIDDFEAHHTSFLMLVGDHAFGKPGGWRRADEITDGLESTLAAVETTRTDIHWLEPTDLNAGSMSMSVNDGPLSISGTHSDGPAVLFCDGAVYRLNSGIATETLRALISIDGGEPISRDDLIARGDLRQP